MRILLLTALLAILPGAARAQHQPVFIHEVQGSGPAVVRSDPVELDAIVIGDFQGAEQLRGFFVQEEDADVDADPRTSEGIFVDCASCPIDVAVGDRVLVRGTPSDVDGMSRVTTDATDGVVRLASGSALPAAAPLALGEPFDEAASHERLEGMLVTHPGTLTVAEAFELDRYGQLVLREGRFFQFTQQFAPSPAGFAAHREALRRRSLVLDDDDDRENAPLATSDPRVFHPRPAFSVDRFIRAGDTLSGLTGVLHWSRASTTSARAWRVRPVIEAFDYDFTPANPRPERPEPIEASVRVATFNVLNFFTTLDEGPARCGPSGGLGCRGANSEAELARQTEKLVTALCRLDADVIALGELENAPGPTSPVAELAAALTDAGGPDCPGPWTAIETGPIGSDAIAVAFVYRPTRVTAVGPPAVLDTTAFTDPLATGFPRNRPALAQTFAGPPGQGIRLTLVANHLKSKSCSGASGSDADRGDGAGCFDATRSAAAAALASWLATDPTGSDDPDFLILGDLNAYAREGPLLALESAGYTNLVARFLGEQAYSYLFDGAWGYLDHALASPGLVPQIRGATHWHINADENELLDYNDPIRDPGESSFEAKPMGAPLFDPESPARSSDHDPLVIGVPEPGGAAALALGVGALSAVGRRGRWARWRRGSTPPGSTGIRARRRRRDRGTRSPPWRSSAHRCR